jgi:hypothetical protein
MIAPDWFKIITDLIYAGVPMRKIKDATELKMGESLIRAYRNGTQPLYPRGVVLINLWCDVTNKTADQLPYKNWFSGHRVDKRKAAFLKMQQNLPLED